MDLEAARHQLDRATQAASPDNRGDHRVRAARQVLVEHGVECLDLQRRHSLEDILSIAAAAPITEKLRDFAVLLVHALGTVGLLPSRGQAEEWTRAFLERVLLNALRRAAYPFDGTPYDKRQALRSLHATIDEHRRPLEPSIPHWIHGVGPPDR
jgi:hypothetical protein